MHALVIRASIRDPKVARETLDRFVPEISRAHGFVAGYWTWSDDQSNAHSMIVFESADSAREAADRVRDVTPEEVTIDSAEVRRVVASA